ncbi:MAG: hypothetical protein L3J49_04800 [Desulfobulbaceae bacterium]|nr:hypothetical protein [Desulfobulbaceae bacterium]
MKQTTFFLLLALLCIPVPGLSTTSTSGCHCFRNRTFDPTDRYNADDYLLTTTYNALIAVSFDISKRQIVMKKMKGGTNGDDLLIGLYVSTRTSTPLDILLSIRDNGGSWQDILQAPNLKEKGTADTVLSAIRSGAKTEEITRMITDNMLCSKYNCSRQDLDDLQKNNLSDKETGLVFALNKQTGTPLKKIVEMYRQQKMSWSEIAHHFKLSPAEVGKNILGESE